MCKAVAPDLVDLSEEDGHATPRGNQITAELDAQARKAVLACPEGAVHLVDGA
jgi:ferredoxin